MGAGGVPVTGLMRLWAPEPAAVAPGTSGGMGWPPTASQLPNGRPAARHIEGKEEVGNAKKMVVCTHLGQERTPNPGVAWVHTYPWIQVWIPPLDKYFDTVVSAIQLYPVSMYPRIQ